MEVGAARKDHQREAEVERGAKSDCRLCIKVGWEGMLLRFPFLFFFFLVLYDVCSFTYSANIYMPQPPSLTGAVHPSPSVAVVSYKQLTCASLENYFILQSLSCEAEDLRSASLRGSTLLKALVNAVAITMGIFSSSTLLFAST